MLDERGWHLVEERVREMGAALRLDDDSVQMASALVKSALGTWGRRGHFSGGSHTAHSHRGQTAKSARFRNKRGKLTSKKKEIEENG